MSGSSTPAILSVRPIRSSRSFPGCRRGSFAGYHLWGNEYRGRGKAVAGTTPPQGAAEALVEEFPDGDVGLPPVVHTKTAIAPSYDLQYRYSADFDWCIRCMKQARSFCNTHLTLSDFLDGGTSTTQRKASLRERYAIMCKYYGTFVTVLLHGWFAIRFYTAKCLKGRV